MCTGGRRMTCPRYRVDWGQALSPGGGGGAIPRVLGRQLPPPPPKGASSWATSNFCPRFGAVGTPEGAEVM